MTRLRQGATPGQGRPDQSAAPGQAKRGRIQAIQCTLLGEDGRVIARGMVSIDVDEGAPDVIAWEGDTYLRIGGVLLWRKTRVMHAGASFQAVR